MNQKKRTKLSLEEYQKFLFREGLDLKEVSEVVELMKKRGDIHKQKNKSTKERKSDV